MDGVVYIMNERKFEKESGKIVIEVVDDKYTKSGLLRLPYCATPRPLYI